jgi:hypothetical protein
MFVGHFGAALAGKRFAPAVNLGTLFLAAVWIDVLWPIAVFLGLEQVDVRPGFTAASPLVLEHIPWTHSLVANLLWAGIFVALCRGLGWLRTGQEAAVVFSLSVSHWLLDLVAHVEDLQLWPGSARYGLGLWTSRPATLLIESGLVFLGAAVYLSVGGKLTCRRLVYRMGFAVFLVAAGVASMLGPQPPGVTLYVASALVSFVVFCGLARWVDVTSSTPTR